MDAIELSLFQSRAQALCDEMGVVLRRTAFSPNIKDRLDFSCALFDADGALFAQAAHIPVHLGSMAYAMADVVRVLDWQPGDVAFLNDPYLGGTHLPDVTVVMPVFVADELLAFAANRAHHANIGADVPGSMPLSAQLQEEGVVIPPQLLLRDERVPPQAADVLARLANVERKLDPAGDLSRWQGLSALADFFAQVSSVRLGAQRLEALAAVGEPAAFRAGMAELNDYAERLAAKALAALPDGRYQARDVLDDDGQGSADIAIEVTVDVAAGHVVVDFDGTAAQVAGNVNCPLAVAAAAVFYVFRCLMPAHLPACAGAFRAIELRAPKGSLLNAAPPAAVVAGNVETSMRVVDVLLAALARALPEHIPAASQGTMNNVAMGARGADDRWDYYETLGGGTGAHARGPGLSGVHAHMTNTLNTPIESLEAHYPLRVRRYALRTGSGGGGRQRGGDGIIREYEFLGPATVTLLSERRRHPPPGLAGGEPGVCGEHSLDGEPLAPKARVEIARGSVLTVATPGGGGWGEPE